MRSKAFWVSIILLFQGSFSQRGLQELHQRLVQGWKSKLVEGLHHPTKTAGAKLRAGFTESPVIFKPTRIIAIKDKPITKPAIAPFPLLSEVTVMITTTNKKVAMTSNKKPPNTVTPFAKAFSPRLAVDMPELDKRKNTRSWRKGKLQLLVQGCSWQVSFDDKRLFTNIAIETAGFKWAPETVPIE